MYRQKSQNTERWKSMFLKEYVENADLSETLLNKTMITHEEFIKFNFIAPLTNFEQSVANLITFYSFY